MNNEWLSQQPEDVQNIIQQNDTKPLSEIQPDDPNRLRYLQYNTNKLRQMITNGLTANDPRVKDTYRQTKFLCRNSKEIDTLNLIVQNLFEES